VSWSKGCASPKHPAVYADVAYYKDWIKGKLSNGKEKKFNEGKFEL
jgi:secreted trypsin-like serine protease